MNPSQHHNATVRIHSYIKIVFAHVFALLCRALT